MYDPLRDAEPDCATSAQHASAQPPQYCLPQYNDYFTTPPNMYYQQQQYASYPHAQHMPTLPGQTPLLHAPQQTAQPAAVAGPTAGPHVCIWDLDETLIIFDSLINGEWTKAQAALQVSPDVSSQTEHDLGTKAADAIFGLSDDHLFFNTVEGVHFTHVSDMERAVSNAPNAQTAPSSGPSNPPSNSTPNGISAPWQHIQELYDESMADASEDAKQHAKPHIQAALDALRRVYEQRGAECSAKEKSLWQEVYQETDRLTDGWLAGGCRLLESLLQMGNGRVKHVLVTNTQLIPAVAKVVIYKYSHLFALEDIYSSRQPGKLAVFKDIMRKHGSTATFHVIGDGKEEEKAALQLGLPLTKVAMRSGMRIQDVQPHEAIRPFTVHIKAQHSSNNRRIHVFKGTGSKRTQQVDALPNLRRQDTIKLPTELLERCLDKHEPKAAAAVVLAVTEVPSELGTGTANSADGAPERPSTPDRPSFLSKLPGSPRVKGLVMLNALVFLMATNWTVVKAGGGDLDPFSFAAWRFDIAALALAPFVKEALREDRKELRLAGLELGLWTAAGYLTQSLGLLYTDASRASFLSTFTVLIVPLLAGFFGRGVKPFVWLSVMAAFVGVGLLEHSGTEFGVGDIWSFMSAVFFGIQVFRTEIVSRRLPYRATLPLISIVMAVIALCSTIAAVTTNVPTLVHLFSNPQDMQAAWMALPWLAILYTGLLSTDVALVCEFEALHDVSSVEAALVYTLEPVLGALIAWVMLGERWGPAGWVGAGLIVASSYATQVYGATPEANTDAGHQKTE